MVQISCGLTGGEQRPWITIILFQIVLKEEFLYVKKIWKLEKNIRKIKKNKREKRIKIFEKMERKRGVQEEKFR